MKITSKTNSINNINFKAKISKELKSKLDEDLSAPVRPSDGLRQEDIKKQERERYNFMLKRKPDWSLELHEGIVYVKDKKGNVLAERCLIGTALTSAYNAFREAYDEMIYQRKRRITKAEIEEAEKEETKEKQILYDYYFNTPDDESPKKVEKEGRCIKI